MSVRWKVNCDFFSILLWPHNSKHRISTKRNFWKWNFTRWRWLGRDLRLRTVSVGAGWGRGRMSSVSVVGLVPSRRNKLVSCSGWTSVNELMHCGRHLHHMMLWSRRRCCCCRPLAFAMFDERHFVWVDLSGVANVGLRSTFNLGTIWLKFFTWIKT
jgi:hypothetical protein